MNKIFIRLVCVIIVTTLLTACDNNGSKVNQVIQDQIQAESNKNAPVPEQSENLTGPEDVPPENTFPSEDASSLEDVSPQTTISTEQSDSPKISDNDIDLDLTTLSSTMVYSEVYNIMLNPDSYLGKKIRMNGPFSVFENPKTGQLYFACIISDATACCAQGIEFTLEGDYIYPDDYPELGESITVSGVFETYDEDGYTYCRLKNARMD